MKYRTIYARTTVNGEVQPPYVQEILDNGSTDYTGSTLPTVDQNGDSVSIEYISKRTYDEFWNKENKIIEKYAEEAEKNQKEVEKLNEKLKASVVKKLVSGEKLTEEEAKFVAGSLDL